MEGTAFLPLPEGWHVTMISKVKSVLLVEMVSERRSACCPRCAQTSRAVHSRYLRRLKDLPCFRLARPSRPVSRACA